MSRVAGLVVGLLLLLVAHAAPSAASALRDGDIIFHTSRSSQSTAVQRATKSPLSHMGLIVHRGGRAFVLEAISTVRYTPLREWVARGVGGRYVVKRLREADRVLTPDAAARLRNAADSFAGRSYDFAFEWSDRRIYCSELVWKAYERALGIRLGRLQELREFDLSDAAVKAKLRERYGRRIPLAEPVISPRAIFDSPELIEVERR